MKDSDIKVEKYLTKAEREKLAEEERIRLEREAAARGDNVGSRGLRQMMGGLDLILKKDKDNDDDTPEREEWMNKPEEEMTDEEKQKFKEFLQKEKDIKEKQRNQREF